jgi:hypothetical protein
MITKFLYKCRRCEQTFYPDFGPGYAHSKPEDVLLMQVTIHECEGTTADGHVRRGIADIKGFNETSDDVVPEGEQHGE